MKNSVILIKKPLNKIILLNEQNLKCPYTGDTLCMAEIENYEIDHIIPRGTKYNGPDAFYNKVLTKRHTNHSKGQKIPFEFISKSEWKSYKNRVDKMELSNKAKKLLTADSIEEVEKLIDKYTGLAETSWIAKLARDITCIKFGWQPGAKGSKKRMHVVSGGLTARVRRKYHLDGILYNGLGNANEKNRADKRHHALDAMVICYLSEWFRDASKERFFKFPEGIHKDYFAQKIEQVFPKRIARSKNQLGDTIYARIKDPRVSKGTSEEITVVRKDIKEVLKLKENIYKIGYVKEVANKIIDLSIRGQIEKYIKNNEEANFDEMVNFINNLRQSEKGGSFVKKVRVKEGSLRPFKDLSKDRNANMKGAYYKSRSVTGKGTRQHGYYLCVRDQKLIKVEPVYAFDSPYLIKKELRKKKYTILHDTLFHAGMQIRIRKDISDEIPSGIYTLRGFQGNGVRLILEDQRGNQNLQRINKIIEAGLDIV